MNTELYQRYLRQYIREAMDNSDGSNAGIASCLSEMKVGKRFTSHREEKSRALADARKAFEEHRHWPLEIVLSHLGLEPQWFKK